MLEENFSLINKTKDKLPACPFVDIKDDILGKDYVLSVAFVSESVSKKLNKNYRQKDYPANVLSFPFSEKSGEIVLCPSVIKKEAKNFDRTFRQFIGFLVIHGMLHLKGMEHSSKMEREEKKYDQKYFNSNRHRVSKNPTNNRRKD
jgi:probable rRNA maturation factor